MSIEFALQTFVLADSSITDIIGARLFPVSALLGTVWPYILYRRASTPREPTHGGSTGKARATFVLSCWSKNYDDSIALAALVIARLHAVRGTWGTGANETIVSSSFVTDEADNFDASPELLEEQYYGRDVTVALSYTV